MTNVEIRFLNEDPIRDIREAALNTVNKKYDSDKELSDEMLLKYVISEHSPIRSITLRITMEGIPYPNSVHFARHVMFVHYVTSSRPDRTGKERDINQTVTHVMDGNIQALIDMARKRLCSGKVDAVTYSWMLAIKEKMAKSEDRIMRAIAKVLVPNCVYRFACPEFKSCGFIENRFSDKFRSLSMRLDRYEETLGKEFKHGICNVSCQDNPT